MSLGIGSVLFTRPKGSRVKGDSTPVPFFKILFLLWSKSGAHASPRARSISVSLGTRVEISITPPFSSCESTSKIAGKVGYLFFGISPPPHTLYRHIVAVKATIDKQSPHGKLMFKSVVLFSKRALLVYI